MPYSVNVMYNKRANWRRVMKLCDDFHFEGIGLTQQVRITAYFIDKEDYLEALLSANYHA